MTLPRARDRAPIVLSLTLAASSRAPERQTSRRSALSAYILAPVTRDSLRTPQADPRGTATFLNWPKESA